MVANETDKTMAEPPSITLADIASLDLDRLSKAWFEEPYNDAVHTVIDSLINALLQSEMSIEAYGQGAHYNLSETLTFFLRPVYRGNKLLHTLVSSTTAGRTVIYHLALLDSLPLFSMKVHAPLQDPIVGINEYNIGRELDEISDKTPNFLRVYQTTTLGPTIASPLAEKVEGHLGDLILFPWIVLPTSELPIEGVSVVIFQQYVPVSSDLESELRNPPTQQGRQQKYAIGANLSLFLQLITSLTIAEREIGFVHNQLVAGTFLFVPYRRMPGLSISSRPKLEKVILIAMADKL